MASEPNVTSNVEITSIIHQLIEKRELLSASFNRGQDGITTLLLGIDAQHGTLIFDASRDDAVNQKIIAADTVIFSGVSKGTKIRFSSAGAQATRFRGGPALAITFPKSLTRIQNRGAFRVGTQGTYCMLPIPGRGLVKVPVNDISVGGVQVLLANAAEYFRYRDTISGCQLDLGSHGKVNCNLEVRTIKQMPSRTTAMGCRLSGLSRSHEALIARFVARQERKGMGP